MICVSIRFRYSLPIYKKENKAEVNNYRPVSLSIVVCIVMESIIKDHVIQYFLIFLVSDNMGF